MFVYSCKRGEGLVITEEGREPITVVIMPNSQQTTIAIGIDASKNVDIIPTKKFSRPRVKHQYQAKGHHEDDQKI